jgi:hypothetical protein
MPVVALPGHGPGGFGELELEARPDEHGTRALTVQVDRADDDEGPPVEREAVLPRLGGQLTGAARPTVPGERPGGGVVEHGADDAGPPPQGVQRLPGRAPIAEASAAPLLSPTISATPSSLPCPTASQDPSSGPDAALVRGPNRPWDGQEPSQPGRSGPAFGRVE